MSDEAPREPVRGHLASRAGLALLKAVSRLPLPALRALGGTLGTLAWWVARPRRHVTLVNLRLCFPEMPERERRRLGHQHFRWFMRSILERFVFWCGPEARIRALVRIEGEEILHAHLGRPLIVLAPHFVALDACGIRLAMIADGFVTMYQPQKNPVLEAAMREGRERFGRAVVVSRRQGLRAVLRLVRDGLPFYYLPDMDLGPRDAVFVPFFGVPAATVTATARLVELTGAAVVPFVSRMTPEGYVGRFHPAWQDFPGDDVEAATRRMNAFIEACVREMPAQYLWSHKRFKTRPPGEPGVYGD
ncbi:MAG TPA: lipid A biosynthesis acyltransferase [Burkholderiaceae bacterium]|nr:lipid A biosynthesis acyltransferase [Burkholderiaceae bacterium]